ncbi:diguanylate phosphodiesterase [Mycobacterium sp. IS-1496]|uniref:putative bifunctional diguanylate cyclase/phosphodiesterase n=1 Tax=Mycobacterium sp. IS-1496 TaxID=1772284 RepID=UPI000741604B|nr:bifunctional diguanylate cyclase/phosphodiesterase [Mycobacterium sp. IS-1496]KUI24529.1 diguanylate phosphodiesterase [Mycobacterium sp. IS-1496]
MRARPREATVIAASGVGAVLLTIWLVGGLPGAKAADNIGVAVFAGYAVVCAVLAARASTGRFRNVWICFAIAFGGWTAGEIVFGYQDLVLGRTAFPSPADIGFILCPIFSCLALMQWPSRTAGHSRVRLLLDGLIFALSLLLLAWVLVLRNVYESFREDKVAVSLALAYPLLDVVVLAVAGFVLVRAGPWRRLPLILLTTSAALLTLSDIAFAWLTTQGTYAAVFPIDVGWVAGTVLFGAAALLSRGVPPTPDAVPPVPTSISLWLPYLPLLVGGTVATVVVLDGVLRAIVIVVIVAICLRQFLASWENRRLMRMVADLALRDPLTGLANLALFNDRLAHAMQLRERDPRAVAVLSLDLNDFKVVNDSLGHSAGNDMLVQVANRLLACVRPGDTVARVGGDEFAVLIEDRVDHSLEIAHRVVESFDTPFSVDGESLLMRPSVGLAVAAPDDDPDPSGEQLFKRADAAMYAAKRSRTDGVHVYSPEMTLVYPEQPGLVRVPDAGVRGRGVAAVQMLGELRQAIDRLELSVVYQPQYHLATSELAGLEALVRWPHPVRGTLAPSDFLPMVRSHGLMGALTDLVVDKALDDAADWAAGGTPVPVAVNLFAATIADTDLPDRIASALDARGLPPAALTVEITEDLILPDVKRTCAVLRELRSHGVRVAIDDFGSGYSALSYLRELPIDEVKLDRRFIGPVIWDPRAGEVVRAVVNLAQTLGLTTVAEGVENAETAERLRAYRCDVAQGFFYSPPLSRAGTAALLRTETIRPPAPVAVRWS